MSTSVTPTRVAAPPAPAAVRDLRGFWRILIAVILPIGPLGIAIVRGILPYWTDQDPQTIVANSLAHPQAMNLMVWLSLVFIPPLLSTMLLLGYLSRRRAPVLATVGAAISFVAYANWGATGNSDYLVYIMGREGYSAEQVVTLGTQLEDHPVATIAMSTWVIGHILGMIVLAIALGRSRMLPAWGAFGLALSQPIHLVSAVFLPSRLLDVTLGWGLTAVCMGLVSLKLLRMSNDEFDRPPMVRY